MRWMMRRNLHLSPKHVPIPSVSPPRVDEEGLANSPKQRVRGGRGGA